MDRTQLLILLSTLNTAVIKALQDTNRALPWVLSKPLRALVAIILGAVEAGIEAVALGSGAFLPMVVTTLTASAPSLILLVVEMANTKPGEPLKSMKPPPPAVLGVMGLCLAGLLLVAGCTTAKARNYAKTADDVLQFLCGTEAPVETCLAEAEHLLATKRMSLANPSHTGDAGAGK